MSIILVVSQTQQKSKHHLGELLNYWSPMYHCQINKTKPLATGSFKKLPFWFWKISVIGVHWSVSFLRHPIHIPCELPKACLFSGNTIKKIILIIQVFQLNFISDSLDSVCGFAWGDTVCAVYIPHLQSNSGLTTPSVLCIPRLHGSTGLGRTFWKKLHQRQLNHVT